MSSVPAEVAHGVPPAAADQEQPAAAAELAAGDQQRRPGKPAGWSHPPEVPLDTKVPVEQLMGAVDAIREHHEKEVAEHKAAEAATAAAAQAGGCEGAGGGCSSSGGSEAAAAAAGAAAEQKEDPEGRPLGYPGTFYLEKPLTGEAAHTLIRMWGPPPGGPPPYNPYGPGAPPFPPPPGAPPYPPAPGLPGYPPAGPPAGAPQYPGYPPIGSASSGGGSSAYPTVHGSGGSVTSARPYGQPNDSPSAPPLQPAPLQQPGGAADPAAGRYGAVPPSMPPAGGGRKKAFICGINYFGTSSQLRGCINDAKCMEYMLRTKFGFKPENILMMTDDCPDPLRRPTKANMFQGFRWLTMDMKPGDSLVFHYSGHGSQQRDYSGEEVDGMNETLCPLDFKTAGDIVDDDINRCLINPLPTGVKLHAIIDACHSGSVMDLPYQAHVRGGYAAWEQTFAFTRSHKGTAGGFAVQFGAAKDSQTAADTQALAGNVSTGAATYCFIQAIERRGTKLSYGELLLAMHNTLQQTMGQASAGPAMMGGGDLLSMLLGGSMMSGGGGYRGQEPVLSANYAFDLGFPFGL